MPIELITAVLVYELQFGWGLAKGIISVIFKNNLMISVISKKPCQKLNQAEKVRPNKHISATRIEIIIGDPTRKYPLQVLRSFWGTLSTNNYKYAVVLSTTKIV